MIMHRRASFRLSLIFACSFLMLLPHGVIAQEARHRWDAMNQIRRDKFDLILPEVMRENGIDMWIVMQREGNNDPLVDDLGHGYTSTTGFYVFTDPGEGRIERAALGISGYFIENARAYDYFGSESELADYVASRDPQVIGINTSRHFGAADGLTKSGYDELVERLGESYSSRLTSAEKMVSDFRSRRVASEIVAFGRAAQMSKELAEKALSNAVITPGVTSLEEVAWWLMDQLLEKGLDTSFGMPSIYITGPDGVEAVSNDRIIQRGDLMMIDWGIGFLNFYTDMKRVAYVLREDETEAPQSLQHAYTQGMAAREVILKTIVPGITAAEAQELIYTNLEKAGFKRMIEFNKPLDGEETDIVIGCHSVGNLGHGIGPSIAFFNPQRLTYTLHPTNLLSIELFAYTPVPEWGGKKVRIPLEDDALVTPRGIEWLVPSSERILLIK